MKNRSRLMSAILVLMLVLGCTGIGNVTPPFEEEEPRSMTLITLPATTSVTTGSAIVITARVMNQYDLRISDDTRVRFGATGIAIDSGSEIVKTISGEAHLRLVPAVEGRITVTAQAGNVTQSMSMNVTK